MHVILQYGEAALCAIWPQPRASGLAATMRRVLEPAGSLTGGSQRDKQDAAARWWHGRELLRLGAPFRQPEWSALALMEGPRFVSEVHQRYIAAGADVITTNSYAVVPFHIGAARFASEGPALAALAGRLAREAADAAGRPVVVAGSLPPVCGSYRPDLFDPAAARPVWQTLIQAMQPYVDVWLAETVSSEAEMVLASEMLAGSNKPWWVSFTLAEELSRSAGPQLRSAEAVGPAVAHAVRRGAQAVLFNCCQPEVIGAAVVAARQSLDAVPAGGERRCGWALTPMPSPRRARRRTPTMG